MDHELFCTCCPKIFGCLITLSCSPCYRAALPNFLYASIPLLLGLSDRSIVKSSRTFIPFWAIRFIVCVLCHQFKHYCTGFHKSQVQLVQKYQSHAFTLPFQQYLVFCLLPHSSQRKGNSQFLTELNDSSLL